MAQRWGKRIVSVLLALCMLFADTVSSLAGKEEDGNRLICGLEEHSHTDVCYEQVLICGLEEREALAVSVYHSDFKPHTHSSECFNDAGNPICGMIEGKYYHTHNAFCRNEEGQCVCGLELKEPHQHTEACYDANGETVCTIPTTTHHHTSACFDPETGACTCGKPEIPVFTSSADNWIMETAEEGHRHTGDCFENRLNCDRAEHIHTDACYADPGVPMEETEDATADAADDPAAIPADGPAEASVQEQPEETTEEAVPGEGSDESGEQTADETQDEPGEETAEEATDAPADEQKNGTADELTEDTANGPTDETAEQPTEQSTNEPTDEMAQDAVSGEDADSMSGDEKDSAEDAPQTFTPDARDTDPDVVAISEFETRDNTLVKYNGEEETVTVPDGILVIGTKAFAENKKMIRVILPDSVETIRNYAFADCPNLEQVAIGPESRLETIGIGAFRNDTKLDVSFAKDVKAVVSNAFEGISGQETREEPDSEMLPGEADAEDHPDAESHPDAEDRQDSGNRPESTPGEAAAEKEPAEQAEGPAESRADDPEQVGEQTAAEEEPADAPAEGKAGEPESEATPTDLPADTDDEQPESETASGPKQKPDPATQTDLEEKEPEIIQIDADEYTLEVLNYSEENQVTVIEAEAPDVEEGVEVLGAFVIENGIRADGGEAEESSLYIRATLNENTELDPLESVSLVRVENGETETLMEDLSEENDMTELDTRQVAVLRDTGYRHLTLTVNPDETNGEQKVILDGMMPRDAEAAVTDVTAAYTAMNGTWEEPDTKAKETGAEAAAPKETPAETADTMTTGALMRASRPVQTLREDKNPAQTPQADDRTDEEPQAAEPADEAEIADVPAAEQVIAAYEITILNGEEEYQPDEKRPITVEIKDSRITADGNLRLWHIRDDGTREQVTEFVLEEGRILFEATGFSVYALVQGPETYTIDSLTVQNLQELADCWNDPDTGGKGFYLSYGTTNYFTSTVNANNALAETPNIQSAAVWYLENTGTANEYKIYTYVGGEKKYIRQSSDKPNEIKLDSDGTPILFSGSADSDTAAPFYLKHATEGRWLQHSKGGSGIRFYTDIKDPVNPKITLTYAYSTRMPDDPYNLDGKQYGLIRYKSGISGRAFSADDSGAVTGKEVLVKQNPLDRQESLYIARNSSISMWKFNTEGEDLYTLSTDVNGSTRFLQFSNDKFILVDTEAAASRIQVIPGTGSYAGKVRLKDQASGKTIQLSGNSFAAKTDSASQADQYLSFAVLSDLEEDDFVPYSARKVSIAENAEQVSNGDIVVLYTRRWNDTEKKYEFYVVDHDGELLYAYEEGGSIQWIGTKINTALWHFTEYYWEGTNTPNYYYELKNDYNNQFLAPQVSGQVFSGDPIGLNLNGRRYNDYYSTILAWDDPSYAYAGLKTTENGSGIESCRIGKAEDFYFAKMEIQSTDELTTVSTIDHTQYGITMKMVDFNNTVVTRDGSPTDEFQHAVMGNSKFVEKNGVKDLLSTDLKENGYPQATITGRSLGELFAGGKEVNHLFLDSTYHGSGYFSYDSTQNFASLHGSNFVVYKEIGTNDTSSKESLKHGNFFPYNDLKAGYFASVNGENLYTAAKKELEESYPRKYEKLYLVDKTDYYFGMEISASFVQTPNGKDGWNHDIIYEFIGDDDFWLYVDDELVVDLGGIHSALPAKVNFALGKVDVNGVSRSLYDVFRENYKNRHSVNDDDPDLQAYLDEKFTEKNGNKVFKDYSTHTMKIFFMERGGGASNLKMRFNLASVNPNQILLTKDVSGIADAEFLTTKFPFQIWFQPPNETDFTTMVQGPHDQRGYRVTYKNTKEEVEFHPTYTSGNVTYDNVFMLKPGQTVEINTPDKIGKYRIVECGVPGNIYNKYKTGSNPHPDHGDNWLVVNDDIISGTEAGADVGGNKLYDYSTSDTHVSERAQVVFTNHVNEDYLRTLSVTKKLYAEDGVTELTEAEDPTGFRYRLYLGESLGYYNMGDYYVKDPAGHYCRYGKNPGDASPHFISLGKSAFSDLTDDEKDEATYTTSPAGSVDKIPTGYTVEVRDLPVSTRFRVEERTEDLPAGYTWKKYERDPDNPYDYEGAVNEGKIQEGYNARMFVENQRGWGLTVKKAWTDKYFTSFHDPIYVAVYAGDTDGDLLPETIRKIEHPSGSVYYFFDKLVSGKAFADYQAYEVTLTGAVTDDEGVVTAYDSISRVTAGTPVRIGAKDRSGATVAPVPYYLVTYEQGTATGATTPGNVRTDKITNQREGGVILRLYDWNTTEDHPLPLAGGVFRLEKDGVSVGDATYTTDSQGLITVMYDFEKDTDYTLTQVSSPKGYVGLSGPITFRIGNNDIAVRADASLDEWYHAARMDETTGSNLIAFLDVKNRPFILKALKIDPADETILLPGAHFAVYRQHTGNNQTGVKDYYPVPGFEDVKSGFDSVVEKIDQEGLSVGTYYLTETEAPAGYDKYEEDILFTITNLGVVTTVPSSLLATEEDAQSGTVTYTIKIPDKKLALVPPILYVSKRVEGEQAQTTKPFRITVSGLTPNKEYVYQRFETTDGVNYHEQSGAAALGFIKVNADGEISFDLMHYERIGISLPYGPGFTVTETADPDYTASYAVDDDEPAAGSSVTVEEFTRNVMIQFINTSLIEPEVVAPTGYHSRRTPFLLMLVLGIILLTLGCGWKIRERKSATAEADGAGKIAETGGPPKAPPPCPQAGRWIQGPPGRGIPMADTKRTDMK